MCLIELRISMSKGFYYFIFQIPKPPFVFCFEWRQFLHNTVFLGCLPLFSDVCSLSMAVKPKQRRKCWSCNSKMNGCDEKNERKLCIIFFASCYICSNCQVLIDWCFDGIFVAQSVSSHKLLLGNFCRSWYFY